MHTYNVAAVNIIALLFYERHIMACCLY